MRFTETEVRTLCAAHTFDANTNWPRLPDGSPEPIFEKILEYSDQTEFLYQRL